MARVLGAIEKLAREICWAEFADPRAVGKTKAQYWQSVSGFKKREYMDEARHLVWQYEKWGPAKMVRLLEATRQAME